MSDQKVSGAKKFGLGAIGALLAGLLVVIGRQATNDDDRPAKTETAVTATGQTDTTGTSGLPVDPPSDTRETVDVEGLATAGSGLEVIPAAATGGRRRAVVPGGCDAESVKRALQYSQEPGYEYLRSRCDLIYRWLHDGQTTHVVLWLCDAGFDSPLAEYHREITVPLPSGWQGRQYKIVTFTNEHGDSVTLPMDAEHVQIIEGGYLPHGQNNPDQLRAVITLPCWPKDGVSRDLGFPVVRQIAISAP